MRVLLEDGANAIIEFAVTMPVLVLLFVSAISFALIVQQDITITEAAAAGAKYGANGHGSDLAGMQLAASNNAAGVSGFTVTAVTYCSCIPGGVAVACTSTCGLYPHTPATYVTVTTNAPGHLLFSITGLPHNLPLSAYSTMRIPWSGQ